jgi:hypothetical protein
MVLTGAGDEGGVGGEYASVPAGRWVTKVWAFDAISGP